MKCTADIGLVNIYNIILHILNNFSLLGYGPMHIAEPSIHFKPQASIHNHYHYLIYSEVIGTNRFFSIVFFYCLLCFTLGVLALSFSTTFFRFEILCIFSHYVFPFFHLFPNKVYVLIMIHLFPCVTFLVWTNADRALNNEIFFFLYEKKNTEQQFYINLYLNNNNNYI